jgi:hypothetical protein
MDGILRRVTERTWVGTLHGYQVRVIWSPGVGSYAVINGRGARRTAGYSDKSGRPSRWAVLRLPGGRLDARRGDGPAPVPLPRAVNALVPGAPPFARVREARRKRSETR